MSREFFKKISDMVYVLLLRGINVGGKNKVIMSELKKKTFG